MNLKICLNCKEKIEGNRCANCGSPVKVERINAQFYKNVLAGVFFLGWEALYTIKAVLIRPGKSIREYLLEDRTKLMNPITFLFLMVLLYGLMGFVFSFETSRILIKIKYADSEEFQSSYIAITKWLNSHQGIANLIIGSFLSLWLYLFFKKQKYNFFEILSLVCYVTGLLTLFVFLLDLLVIFETPTWVSSSMAIFSLVYMVWANAQFFGNKFRHYIKSFSAFALGLTTYFGVKYFLCRLIDEIILYTTY